MYTHHNPEVAQPIINKLLSKLGNQWSDCSYGNDCVASISRALPNTEFEDFMEIYVPNSTQSDEYKEEFNTYSVKFGDGSDGIYCETFSDVLELVKQFEANL